MEVGVAPKTDGAANRRAAAIADKFMIMLKERGSRVECGGDKEFCVFLVS